MQAITPVRSGEITGALLDTLVQVAYRNELEFKRSIEHDTAVPILQLEDELLNEGLDVTSANQVFITYRYEANQRRFKSNILQLNFIYRPEEYDDADTPIMVIDATHPIIRNVLTSNGTTLDENEAVFEPFWDQLRLHQLDDSSVVQVGNRVVREEEVALAEKERIVGIIRRFLY